MIISSINFRLPVEAESFLIPTAPVHAKLLFDDRNNDPSNGENIIHFYDQNSLKHPHLHLTILQV